MNEELGAILRTIREVEVSLDRRAARAQGTLVMIWGLAAASIFAFYQIATWNPQPLHEALGAWLSWVWLAPLAVAYVASAIVGARFGRMGASPQQRRDLRRGVVPAILITLLAAALVVTQRYAFIYGGITLVGGVACLLPAWRAPRSAARTTGIAVGAAMAVAGAALLALASAPWAPGAAAAAYLVGYLALGTVIYRQGR